jgi:hypothetical protein
MPKIFAVVVFFLLCVSTTRTSAQQSFNSFTWRDYCKLAEADPNKLSGSDLDHAMMCTFYVNGVIDGYMIGVDPAKSFICLPKNVTRGQFALIVAKYLDDHPEMLQNDPEYLIVDAVAKAFPCKR